MNQLTSSSAQDMTWLRVLLHGDSGIGKTTSLAQLPTKTTIIAGAERSLLPLRNKNFPTFKISTWADVRVLLGELQKPEEFRQKFIDAKLFKTSEIDLPKCLCIDSLSILSAMAIENIVSVERVALMEQRTKGKSKAPPGVYEEQMTLEDWGVFLTKMRSMVCAFNRLPMHIIFTCLSQWTTDKKTGRVSLAPAISGKFSVEVSSHFDLVLHMENMETAGDDGKTKEVRVWRTLNSDSVIAKDSSGVLEPFIETKWAPVFKSITGKNGKGG